MREFELSEIEQRPRRYWNADGISDITMGALWIVWGITLGLPAIFAPGVWLRYYWMAVPLILIGGGVTSNRIATKLKQRLTFPRTGYVEWPAPGLAATVPAVLIAAAAAAGIGILVIRRGGATLAELSAPGTALLLSAAFLFSAVRFKLPHYVWLAAASVGIGLVIAVLHLGIERGIVWLFIGTGICSVVCGALRLRNYLRRNPPPAEGNA